ncbi:hypothetical protein PTKIN_Ptkin17bG0096500 [Pterospermum kingtungense]
MIRDSTGAVISVLAAPITDVVDQDLVEARVAVKALELAKDTRLFDIEFEGDSFTVINRIRSMAQICLILV